ncbi:lysine N(6)-hydroxylase/L-ornithine N(5)-oxygenase family protein [Haloarcula salinisoli]|uniref:SidA/IucD/PvdA family monooxygenase n=1 Tax=Haloarcula salinisoli TaxID=2487746 RepID=A0A8J7YNK6_9EURY|nr:SidA/IucD/PvdA family monooxygenase [Halomicroarcula salinisoli]MBX0288586.1 SidA/IucD/PvdA family monooxygenase [Halomicroarcula salinisoli]MBX0306034.1 SidA/IucD/PvdA family monooxygenase [Halomicroarcula salinisoli]
MKSPSYDVVGIGIGPSNLALAALLNETEEPVDALFLEQKSSFGWHEDMLIEGTALMSSILGDMVTPVDPTNSHSFLNYLHEQGRFQEFHNYDNPKIPRREFNNYCKWVAERVDNCEFSRRVESVTDNGSGFEIQATDPETGEMETYHSSNIVLGVGMKPYVPESLRGHPKEDVFHSSVYLSQRDRCLDADSITVVGSGQSAAEIVLDLLRKQPDNEYRLDWFTRSDGFYPVDPSDLTREIRTPDYIDYFHDLPQETSEERVEQQDLLYKGISPATSAAIYDTLYHHSIEDDPTFGMLAKTEVQSLEDGPSGAYRLKCQQREEDERFYHDSEVVILGTGYNRPIPEFLDPLHEHIEFAGENQFEIGENFEVGTTGLDGSIFAQNRGFHEHGFNTADLSISPYQGAKIINEVVGEEVYSVGEGDRFQSFGTDQFLEQSPNSRELERPITDD